MADGEHSLRALLDKIAIEQKYNNYNISVKEISSGGANYTSKLYKAIISESGDNKKHDLHLFAKVAILGKQFREQMDLKIFNTENFAYAKLFKIYRNIEKMYGLSDEEKFSVPECYGCDPTELHEILVLEDLNAKGYHDHNRFLSIDWDYSVAAIKELAKLHALSFAFNKLYPNEYEESLKILQFKLGAEKLDVFYGNNVKLSLETVKPEYKDMLERYIQEFMKNKFVELFDPVLKPHICHHDYRSSNLLSKKREDGTVDIKIVDLQTMQGGSPVVDLLYFIFTGSDEAFRAQHYGRLLDCYYQQLSAAMRRLRLHPDEHYSRADFDYELKEKLPFGLSIALFALPIITVETENAPKVDENMDMTSFSVDKTSDLYAERLNGVVNDYVKWGILK